ncbi:protein of unknown function (plasmid) [Caballeronia sp. S22]
MSSTVLLVRRSWPGLGDFLVRHMIVKVNEPQPAEREMLRPGQILYAYLHLAPDPAQALALVDSERSVSHTRRSPERAAGCRCSRP